MANPENKQIPYESTQKDIRDAIESVTDLPPFTETRKSTRRIREITTFASKRKSKRVAKTSATPKYAAQTRMKFLCFSQEATVRKGPTTAHIGANTVKSFD